MFQATRRFLFEPSSPLSKYVLLASLLAMVGSTALFATALAAVAATGADLEALMPPARVASVSELFGTVVFAPVVETLLLAGMVRLLSTCSMRPARIATSSAIRWGVFHGVFGALWFFGTAWSFFVFTCAYLAW